MLVIITGEGVREVLPKKERENKMCNIYWINKSPITGPGLRLNWQSIGITDRIVQRSGPSSLSTLTERERDIIIPRPLIPAHILPHLNRPPLLLDFCFLRNPIQIRLTVSSGSRWDHQTTDRDVIPTSNKSCSSQSELNSSFPKYVQGGVLDTCTGHGGQVGCYVLCLACLNEPWG